jgi:hypothetical protein
MTTCIGEGKSVIRECVLNGLDQRVHDIDDRVQIYRWPCFVKIGMMQKSLDIIGYQTYHRVSLIAFELREIEVHVFVPEKMTLEIAAAGGIQILEWIWGDSVKPNIRMHTLDFKTLQTPTRVSCHE